MAKLIYFSARSGTRVSVQAIRDERIGQSTWAQTHILQEHKLTEEEAELPLDVLCKLYKFRVRLPYRRG